MILVVEVVVGLLVVASAVIMTTLGAAAIVMGIGIVTVIVIVTMTVTTVMKGAMIGEKREVSIWHTLIETQQKLLL